MWAWTRSILSAFTSYGFVQLSPVNFDVGASVFWTKTNKQTINFSNFPFYQLLSNFKKVKYFILISLSLPKSCTVVMYTIQWHNILKYFDLTHTKNKWCYQKVLDISKLHILCLSLIRGFFDSKRDFSIIRPIPMNILWGMWKSKKKLNNSDWWVCFATFKFFTFAGQMWRSMLSCYVFVKSRLDSIMFFCVLTKKLKAIFKVGIPNSNQCMFKCFFEFLLQKHW